MIPVLSVEYAHDTSFGSEEKEGKCLTMARFPGPTSGIAHRHHVVHTQKDTDNSLQGYCET